jgi:hypothetical protein
MKYLEDYFVITPDDFNNVIDAQKAYAETLKAGLNFLAGNTLLLAGLERNTVVVDRAIVKFANALLYFIESGDYKFYFQPLVQMSLASLSFETLAFEDKSNFDQVPIQALLESLFQDLKFQALLSGQELVKLNEEAIATYIYACEKRKQNLEIEDIKPIKLKYVEVDAFLTQFIGQLRNFDSLNSNGVLSFFIPYLYCMHDTTYLLNLKQPPVEKDINQLRVLQNFILSRFLIQIITISVLIFSSIVTQNAIDNLGSQRDNLATKNSIFENYKSNTYSLLSKLLKEFATSNPKLYPKFYQE